MYAQERRGRHRPCWVGGAVFGLAWMPQKPSAGFVRARDVLYLDNGATVADPQVLWYLSTMKNPINEDNMEKQFDVRAWACGGGPPAAAGDPCEFMWIPPGWTARPDAGDAMNQALALAGLGGLRVALSAQVGDDPSAYPAAAGVFAGVDITMCSASDTVTSTSVVMIQPTTSGTASVA